MTDRDQRFIENTTPPTPGQLVQPSAKQDVPKQKMQNHTQNNLARLHLLDAFCENPANVTFETQEPDETVLLFLRKSKWVNVPWIAMTIFLAIIPIVMVPFKQQWGIINPSLPLLSIAIPFYYLLVATYAFLNFITWYYNAALITNKRVVDIDFHQLVFKDVAETKIALVQDVSYNQTGVLQNVLGFGFVLIQTAGTLDNFEFYDLPQPSRVADVVENLIGGRRAYEP